MKQPWLYRSGLLLVAVLFEGHCFAQATQSHGFESVVAAIRKSDVKLAEELEKRLKQSQGEVEQFKKGHLIFGRIKLEDGNDPHAVVSQMIILKDGYFVDAIGAAGKPVGFRLHGYQSVNMTPKGPGPIEDLGVILLKRLPVDQLATAIGRVEVESKTGAPQLNEVRASWSIVTDPINTPHNGTEGMSHLSTSIESKIASDGTFKASGMSPGKYTLFLTAPNCVQQFLEVDFKEGEARDLGAIRLEVARKVNVEFAVSKDGEFIEAKFKKTSLKADDRWRASDDIPEYGFDLLVSQKEGNLLFDYRYGPCHIKDLGRAELTDDLEVDLQDLESKQPQNIPIEDGHVYVILQSNWKHWILLRATIPETAP